MTAFLLAGLVLLIVTSVVGAIAFAKRAMQDQDVAFLNTCDAPGCNELAYLPTSDPGLFACSPECRNAIHDDLRRETRSVFPEVA